VTLLLLLQERAWAYDFFTPGLILFLILITCRLPYINSYTFLFETCSIDSWAATNHVGLQKNTDPIQNSIHTFFVLAAHCGAAVGTAALRVYLDVTYGKEVMSMQAGITPALELDVGGLSRFSGTIWSADARLSRLAAQGIHNGTLEVAIPVNSAADLGIGEMALIFWYVSEEVGCVCLLCVCYIHIWLGAGVADNKHPPMNPFKPPYWQHLFRVCVLWTLINTSLYRAFPTAHGSLHRTLYLCQYQAWNPNVHVIDTANGEAFARVIGGLIGMMFAIVYNRMLVSTEKADSSDDGSDAYYKLMWGLDRDETHTRSERIGKRKREDEDPYRQDSPPQPDGSFYAAGMVCVICRRTIQTGCQCQVPVSRKALRIPGALNYSK